MPEFDAIVRVAKISNGFLVEHPTGKKVQHVTLAGVHECEDTVVTFARTPQDVAGIVETSLLRTEIHAKVRERGRKEEES